MTPRDRSTNRLLMNSDQLELTDRSLEQQAIEQGNDAASEARRTEYLERLRAALPELRKLEGFPIGSDDDVLALSDPPYYTACPNPFLAEFVARHGTAYDETSDDYRREPFAADISEGRNDPVYNAHSYHTKVPHKAIMRYILHYTKPGDVVFDGFCGTGMTGVAAQLCGSPDPDFRATVEAEWAAAGHHEPEWGVRYAVLGDLSPAATFIAYVYNSPVDGKAFGQASTQIVADVESELGWMYQTTHSDGKTPGFVNYTVWSDVFVCPSCGEEVTWWDAVIDRDGRRMREAGSCPVCSATFLKTDADRAYSTAKDAVLGVIARQARVEPVLINYSVGARGRSPRFEKSPDERDRDILRRIEASPLPTGITTRRMPDGDEGRRNDPVGWTHVHHFFTPRALRVFGAIEARCHAPTTRAALYGGYSVGLRLSRFLAPQWFAKTTGPMKPSTSGTLYAPSLSGEQNWLNIFESRVAAVGRGAAEEIRAGQAALSTSSMTVPQVPVESVDYIFLDPPFGSNLSYSDLNAFYETWLRVATNAEPEAIVSRRQGKTLGAYTDLMRRSFASAYAALKPGRWMTVEFHNSSNAVWNAIQEAIQRAGFVVADVRILDKQQGSFKQYGAAGTVKQDLVISAYKPLARLEQRFMREAGTEQGAWDFMREHLGQLPVFVESNGRVEVVAERQNYLLFDRMVAFHIQRGATVPMSAAQFYSGLRSRFLERDDMYFTELQGAEYDRRRLDLPEIEQLSVFVTDEKSAIQWIRAELSAHPQTFQDLQPKFLRELNQNRYEELPELRELLEQGFLEDGATHQWRVPDPGKEADLEALRQRALLNEFAAYLPGSAKLKRFRIEAVRAGFADLWAKRAYAAIVAMAERLPDEVVQEDPALLMYYDNAVTREGAG